MASRHGGDAGPGASAAPGGAVEERTDLRLLPCGLVGWAAGWSAPLLPPGGAATATVALGVIAAAAAGWLLWPRPAAAAPVPAEGTELATVPRSHRWAGGCRSPGAGWRWSVLAAALVGAAVLGVSAVNASRAAGGAVDELAAAQAVVSADLRITGDARLAQTADLPGRPLWVVSAVVEQVTGRGQTSAASAPVVVLATDPGWTPLVPSTVVRATGRLGPNLRISREVAVLRVSRAPVVVSPPSQVQRVAEDLRAGLRTAVSDLAPDPRGLLPGLVVGDESLMPPDLTADARTTGLTHLTAVSGANVSIVVGVVLALARWCGVRAWAVPASGAAALAGFVVLARPDPSVIRAAVMGLAVLLGLAAGARRRRMSGLCAAVVILLLIDPWLARSYGFALSALASGAIVVLVPGWTERWSGFVPAPLAAALAVPVAAQLVCAPVVVLLSDQVSLVAVAANVLAAPAVAPATVLGVLVAVVAPVAPPVAQVLARVAGLPVTWIAGVARWFADRPYAAIDWPGGVTGALALAALSVGAAVVLPVLLRRVRLVLALALALAVVAAALTGIALRRLAPGWPASWQVVACDVGQGDAVVLSVVPGSAIVVDAGPDPAAVDGCLQDLGVHQVPLLVVTHAHLDHYGGVPGVLAGRHVGAIAVAPGGALADASPQLDAAVRRAGAAVEAVTAGWSADIGGTRVDVLWPPVDTRALSQLDPAESAENNASVVARIVVPSGLRVLLTGDIEPSAQRAILRSGVDLRADVLKVPHHGSRHQDPDFLRAVQPTAALISAGVDNDYGHPSPATVDLLEAAGAATFRTDTGGDIAVAGTPQQLRVTTRRSGFPALAVDRRAPAHARALPAGVGGPWDADGRWPPRPPPPRAVLASRPSS